jgi:arginine decarboxylase
MKLAPALRGSMLILLLAFAPGVTGAADPGVSDLLLNPPARDAELLPVPDLDLSGAEPRAREAIASGRAKAAAKKRAEAEAAALLALEQKDELFTQFNMGLISLEDRAKGEVLFWETCRRALYESREDRFPDEEFEQLKRILASKYLCNFSLFRSAPDSWAIQQLFPVVPIHRLNETPKDFSTLVDVTCDSDGKIDRFVDLKDVKQTLELHDWQPGENYYLGIFLTGAYQEVMGSHHNLFGHPDEAQVVVNPDGGFHVTKIVSGSRISDMLNFARYDVAQLSQSYERQLQARVKAGQLSAEEAEQLVAQYREAAGLSTYLQ